MNNNKTYHFVGIKGTGMSALALILHHENYKVQGSDVSQRFYTQEGLEGAHIPIFEFSPNNIRPGQVIIQGNAFGEDHPEIKRAKELNLEIMRYHTFLGELIEAYTSIGITGSHGKTTTTGMLSHVLSGAEPTSYLIGDGTGHGEPEADYFVLEADEYRRHFLSYKPDYAVVTNIDFDHPDYFEDLEDVFNAYQSFLSGIKKMAFICGDDENARKLTSGAPIKYYGLNDGNDVQAINIEYETFGTSFEVIIDKQSLGRYEIPVFGNHNIQNALAVIAVTYYENIKTNKVKEGLKSYPGVKRRFVEREIEGQFIIDDYAHHPNEIEVTIQAARQRFPEKEIIAIFQPHTFSRTEALLNEFANTLATADRVYLCDIFSSAREQTGDISIEDLAALIETETSVLQGEDVTPLLENHDADKVMLFMGAGDIQKFEEKYIALLEKSQN